MVGACGDGETVYIYVEAGGPGANKRDGTAILDDSGEDDLGSCDPVAVPDFTFIAPPAYQKLCSDQDLNSILLNCVFGEGTQATCDAAIEAAPDNCLECMAGAFDSNPARPLVRYIQESPFYASTGTCMANIVNDPNDECGNAFGQVETCAYAACIPACVGKTDDAKSACYDKAIGSVCTKGVQAFDSAKCRAAYTGKTYGFCISGDNPKPDAGGKKLNNLEYYTLVTQLACGSNPNPDAGAPVDAGKDGDAAGPDADAGAADADADAPPP